MMRGRVRGREQRMGNRSGEIRAEQRYGRRRGDELRSGEGRTGSQVKANTEEARNYI